MVQRTSGNDESPNPSVAVVGHKDDPYCTSARDGQRIVLPMAPGITISQIDTATPPR